MMRVLELKLFRTPAISDLIRNKLGYFRGCASNDRHTIFTVNNVFISGFDNGHLLASQGFIRSSFRIDRSQGCQMRLEAWPESGWSAAQLLLSYV